jgi:hypothetical protein
MRKGRSQMGWFPSCWHVCNMRLPVQLQQQAAAAVLICST